MLVMELLSGSEHGVLVLQGPRERLPGIVGAFAGSQEVIVGPPTLTTAELYAEALVERAAEVLRAAWGGRASWELEELSRGLGWEGRLRCALGLVRDVLPRRRPPQRLVCVCCPAVVTDEEEQARVVRALVEHAPELPWFYGIRLVVHATEAMVVAERPPFVRVCSLLEVAEWSPRAERGFEGRGERWIR